MTFDDALLAEVARLLPGIDVVRWHQPVDAVDPVPADVARARCVDELRRVGASLVTGWPEWLPSVPPPDRIELRWSYAERLDQVRVDLAATAPGDHDIDVDAARARLTSAGWDVAAQDQGGRNVRLIGRRAGDRIDVVDRPGEHVVFVRIVGAPIAVGALGQALVTAGPRDLPWPRSPG